MPANPTTKATFMIRILHLSDVHFGRDRADLVASLMGCVAHLSPTITVLSGDLTQRARPAQFQAAMALMDRLPTPNLIVPGNHDVPMDRPWERLFAPWKAYSAHVHPDRTPLLDLPGVRLMGMNTATPWFQQRGTVRRADLAQTSTRLQEAPARALRVVVLHHPLIHPPHTHKPAMYQGRKAASTLVDSGADLVLSGHLHSWGTSADLLRTDTRSAIAVSCGTSLSTRVRGTGNDFAILDLFPDAPVRAITVTRWQAPEGTDVFQPDPTAVFHETAQGWRPDTAGPRTVHPIDVDDARGG